ncbi:prenylated rab acceptor PRA1 [Dacryopinax primogenitus]|uniref:PRA1 family protein n=1 Tax=Dacryopinax primogenitus (strain DJM 731) TaxID=1858805 RepID=M5G6P1_DACPD|nr:prenylated rab acceptor PRA1 [Dacryopinax primogenitus]EJU04369.1 prenylated rab acceptor PRA1 [Dacryopinax primogenitus]
MEYVLRGASALKTLRETRLSALKGPGEFFDYHRISRPADMNEATSRISYNTRYFSGNYLLIILGLAIYAIITKPILLIAIFFLVGGFAAINRLAPESIQVGNQTITQSTLYIALFVIGLPLLMWASPVWTFFWLLGSSAFIILFHAALMEPGIESEYANMPDNTNV